MINNTTWEDFLFFILKFADFFLDFAMISYMECVINQVNNVVHRNFGMYSLKFWDSCVHINVDDTNSIHYFQVSVLKLGVKNLDWQIFDYSGKDNLLPSVNEAQRLAGSLQNCKVRIFKDNGHTFLMVCNMYND